MRKRKKTDIKKFTVEIYRVACNLSQRKFN